MPNHFTTKVIFDRSMSDDLKKFLTGLSSGKYCRRYVWRRRT